MASVHMYSPRKTSLISSVPFIVGSFFTDSSIYVMVHGQPLSLCLRNLPTYRLSFSPWYHLDLTRPEHFYLSGTSNHAFAYTASTASQAKPPPTQIPVIQWEEVCAQWK